MLETHGGDLGDLVAAIKTLRGKGDERQARRLQEAQETGIFGREFLDGVRRGMLKAQPIAQDKLTRLEKFIGSEASANSGYLNRVAAIIKAASGIMTRGYAKGDEMFRLALFMRRRSEGRSVQEAAHDAIKGFVDYDINAPLINAMRRYTHPFIAYTYKALPMITEAAAIRPWKAAKVAFIYWAANAVGSMLAGGDEKRERTASSETRRGVSIRLPFKDSYNQQLYLDATRFLPLSDVADTNDRSALPILQPLMPGGLPMIAAEMLLNRKAFDGKEIVNKNTPWYEQAAQLGQYGYEALAPNNPIDFPFAMLRGVTGLPIPSSYSGTKIARAIEGRQDQQGRMNSVPASVLSTLGVKTFPVNPEELIQRTLDGFKNDETKAKQVSNQARKSFERGNISEAERDRIIAGQDAVLKNIQQKRDAYMAQFH